MSAIDDYLDKLSDSQKAGLTRIRTIVAQTIPEAEEVISYGMPGFKYRGKYLLGFGAFKDHMSLFPTAAPIEALEEKLGGFEISRGTIQFTSDNPIPESLIKELVAVRVADISAG